MKKTRSLPVLAAVTALGLASPGLEAGPRLEIPDFSHLRSQAVETVDVSLDGFLMSLARRFAHTVEGGEPRNDALALLEGIESVRVRSYDFDADNAYSSADVDAVRKQLQAPGWSPLAQVRRRDERSNVDVYLNLDGGKVLGLAVVASEPRSFTIVNIVGDIDLDKLAKLEGQFGIPRVSSEQ